MPGVRGSQQHKLLAPSANTWRQRFRGSLSANRSGGDGVSPTRMWPSSLAAALIIVAAGACTRAVYGVGVHLSERYREIIAILQYGTPRTASTWQFTTLCVIATLKASKEGKSASCQFHDFNEEAEINVIKMHHFKSENLYPNAIIFTTAHNGTSIVHDVESYGATVEYEQVYEDFVKVDLGILQHYVALFELGDTEMKILHEYMRYWQVIRRCCGRQSSIDWRLTLRKSQHVLAHMKEDYDAVD